MYSSLSAALTNTALKLRFIIDTGRDCHWTIWIREPHDNGEEGANSGYQMMPTSPLIRHRGEIKK